MSHFDVFNGDADGLCALHMLRLAHPREAHLITGVKRDHALLERVVAQSGDSVTVLDVSLVHNIEALQALLADGVEVEYFDHHCAPAVPDHPLLDAHIDSAPDVCTSVLVDRHLGGKHRQWAVVAAYGDNIAGSARLIAQDLGFSDAELEALRELGECLNYNAYGAAENDLIYPPGALYERLRRHADPLRFMAGEDIFARLKAARDADLQCAVGVAPQVRSQRGAIYLLPDAAWSRRVIGTFANRLAAQNPSCAFAVLAPCSGAGLVVSLRAAQDVGATVDRFARSYGGGGRHAAAGIDCLPRAQLGGMIDEFARTFLHRAGCM